MGESKLLNFDFDGKIAISNPLPFFYQRKRTKATPPHATTSQGTRLSSAKIARSTPTRGGGGGGKSVPLDARFPEV